VTAFLRDNPDPSDEEIRHALSGNLCRCTGYQGILKAVRHAAEAGVDSDGLLRGSARSGAQNREENQ
jgi:carbon-monoxide dehydrogenase small subunit